MGMGKPVGQKIQDVEDSMTGKEDSYNNQNRFAAIRVNGTPDESSRNQNKHNPQVTSEMSVVRAGVRDARGQIRVPGFRR